MDQHWCYTNKNTGNFAADTNSMKRERILLVVMIVLMMVSNACRKEETGTLEVFVRATGTGGDMPPAKSRSVFTAPALSTLSFDTAKIFVSDLLMQADFSSSLSGTNTKPFAATWISNNSFDLLNWEGQRAIVELETGSFTNMRFTATSLKPEGINKPNFYLAGTLNEGGTVYRLTVIINENYTFRCKEETGFLMFKDDLFRAAVEIYLLDLFKGITSAELSAADKVQDRIVISKTSNTGLYDRIFLNLKADQDLHLGDDE